MSERDGLSDRARALRAELDASFARPRELERPELTELLALRAGDDPYAVRMSEVQALFTGRPITPLPTPVPELLGLCAIRGAFAPVYDLAPLLGRPFARRSPPRWLVLVQHRELIALAFDALDGQARMPTTEIAAPGTEGQHSVVLVHGVLRPLIRIATVLEAIERRVRPLQEPRGNG